MRIFTDKDECPPPDARPVATLGVFDGVHRGHQKIFHDVVALSHAHNVPSLAITFCRHPRLALGRSAPPLITSLEKRLDLIEKTGIDAVWLLDFSHELALMPAQVFAKEYFHDRLNASAVVLGEAARFGYGRDGNAGVLSGWAKSWKMQVKPVPALYQDGVRISSTAVRLAVQSGDLDKAMIYLGRRFSVLGTVVHGQGLARTYGFPTINLDPHHELRPPSGIYATTVAVGQKVFPSVTNVGRPPTDKEIQDGLGDFMIETHLLGFDGDLYGSDAEVLFVAKLRDILRFADADGLIRQVRIDMEAARDYFDIFPQALL